ncbi:MAG: hypothetical protein ACOY3I_00945 [Verrucomicrobiota bacterium]
MTKHLRALIWECMGTLCVLTVLQGCADPASTSSAPHATSAQTSAVTEQKSIWITVKEGTHPHVVRNFVEYLGCAIKENIPPGGELYVLRPPVGIRAETLLSKFTAHPWIVRASLKPDSYD